MIPHLTALRVPPRVARPTVFLAFVVLVLAVTPGASGAPTALAGTRISAGFAHTCVLTSAGGVKCWGLNAYGELGNGGGPLSTALTPVDVVGLKSGFKAVSAGGQHTCALTTGGGVKCWGQNEVGQLGNGTTTPTNGRTPVPANVAALRAGVNATAAGSGHTCALTSGGGVKCWGAGYASGSKTPTSTPVDIPGLPSGVTAITAGFDQSCALTSGGGAKCWGWNIDGQLGNGSTAYSYTPVDVVGLTSGVRAISAGLSFTCAVTTGGGAKCWGWNEDGQLGNGSRSVYPGATPIDVIGLTSGVSAITAGGHHTCALMGSGGVKCWGSNEYGQLGNGSRTSSTTPVDVSGLRSGVSAISAGFAHTCALMRGGGVKCWGYNYGRLGNGSREELSTKPVDVVFSARPGKRPAVKAPSPPSKGTSRSRTGAPPSAKLGSFVGRIENVLSQSAAGRRELAAALSAGFNCSIAPSAAGLRIARVVDNRRSILGQLGSLRASDRQTREALGLLRAALQHSITADVHYRDGFSSIANAQCPVPSNANFTLARRSDVLASTAKQRFVTVFNRLARSIGRRTWSVTEI